jgi:hypothetical protein
MAACPRDLRPDPGRSRPRRRDRGVRIHSRDDGAFPHVNFYLPTPSSASASSPAPACAFAAPKPRLHHPRQQPGLSRPEWPAPAATDILVVGDSQVFGLGVDDDATFSARLAATRAAPCSTPACPPTARASTSPPPASCSPAQGRQRRRRPQLRQRPLRARAPQPRAPRRVGRLGRAQRDRPRRVTEFPGRRWLFSRSHAVYALRRWLHERGSAAAPRAPSSTTRSTSAPPPRAACTTSCSPASARTPTRSRRRHRALARPAARRDRRLSGPQQQAGPTATGAGRKFSRGPRARARPARRHRHRGAPESGREVRLTAAMIREDRRRPRRVHPGLLVRDGSADQRAPRMICSPLRTSMVRSARSCAPASPPASPQIPRPPSMFRGYLAEFKALCEQHGAELVVVALPIDVQVDAREWAKYGVTDPPDMHGSLVLLDDLLADAQDLGLRGLDATPSLRAAGPGAFLDHDIHMTAKRPRGPRRRPRRDPRHPGAVPAQGPRPGLPVGRSFAPATASGAAPPRSPSPATSTPAARSRRSASGSASNVPTATAATALAASRSAPGSPRPP